MKKILLAAVVLSCLSTGSMAAVLNFDDQGLTGPSFFASASPLDVNQTIGGVDVNITGGTILNNTSFLPGNTTAVYGTASFFDGGLNPIVVTFSQSITNFFLDLFNGNVQPVTYVIEDNAGNSTTVTLPSNSDGGTTTIGFAATGNKVTITGLVPETGNLPFDFFIDNIGFNEPLPQVPLPAGLPLLAGGLIALGFLRRRQARS